MALGSWPMRAKVRAAFCHFVISLVIFLVIATWLLVWGYPSFYFGMSGGMQGLMLMLGVDVVLGPILTFLVFHPDKKIREIISDFVIIALVQLAALSYGLYTVVQERPKAVVVYAMGTATVFSARELAEDKPLSQVDMSGFVRLAGVPLVIHNVVHGKAVYTDAAQHLQVMEAATAASRKAITDEKDQAQLAQWDRQYGSLWVLSVLGKYTGAYIVLDTQWRLIGVLGELPI